MNKRIIKSIFENSRYFTKDTLQTNADFQLLVVLAQAMAINSEMGYKALESSGHTPESIEKERDRAVRETMIMTRLYTLKLISECPTTYDILENPKGLTTQEEIYRGITSEYNKDKEVMEYDGFYFVCMSKDEYALYVEVFEDLMRAKKLPKTVLYKGYDFKKTMGSSQSEETI